MPFPISSAAYLAATLLGAQQAPPAAQNPAPPPFASAATVLSPDKQLVLSTQFSRERPTLFLFYRPESGMEKALADRLDREAGAITGLRWIPLKTGTEPAAKQHGITETPTAIVYDRRGRLVLRTSDPTGIVGAVRKALGVMRIDWAADDDPRMDEMERLTGRRFTGGIIRTMSFRPDWLAAINEISIRAHFRPAALDVRTHELIATHVSALNKCKF